MSLDRVVNDLVIRFFWFERRIDRFIRPVFDRLLRPPIQAIVQWIVRHRAPDYGLGLAQEHILPGEEHITGEIVELMTHFLQRTYPPPEHAERAGNTKTYGVVRGELTVRDDVPPELRHGLFSEPVQYPAWVRFSGPGPFTPPDMRDNAIMSLSAKVMGVPGPKLMPDESATQDLFSLSAPTFTTPDVVQNVILQSEIGNGTPVMYHLRPSHLHLCDLIMQVLYANTVASPLQVPYWGCVSYLLGPGQAMQYRFVPRPFPHLKVPRRPGPDYLREAMASTLSRGDVIFDLLVQTQTDPRRMPIEYAAVIWSTHLSSPRPVATLRLPRQVFDSPAQLAFADVLSYSPWHAMPEHRPLGNMNRARRVIYSTLSAARQQLNGVQHVEPTGEEEFGDDQVDH